MGTKRHGIGRPSGARLGGELNTTYHADLSPRSVLALMHWRLQQAGYDVSYTTQVVGGTSIAATKRRDRKPIYVSVYDESPTTVRITISEP